MNVFVKKMKVRDLAIPPVTFNLNTEASAQLYFRGEKVMQFYHSLVYVSIISASHCLLCSFIVFSSLHKPLPSHNYVGTIPTFFL